MIRHSNKCINIIRLSLNNSNKKLFVLNNTCTFENNKINNGININNNNNNNNIYNNKSMISNTGRNYSTKRTEEDQDLTEESQDEITEKEEAYMDDQRDMIEEDEDVSRYRSFNEDFDDDGSGARFDGETAQQQFNRETREDLFELEHEIMDVQPPLYKQIKYEIHGLYNEDPSFWDVKRLSQVFQIHPGRVVALIRFVDIEKMEIEKGFPVHKDIELQLEMDWGVRLEDEYMGEDDQKQYQDGSHFAFHKGVGRGTVAINDSYKNSNKKGSKKNGSSTTTKPDPIHEIPTKIPDALPEKPIYFRGPTFVLPRKKNIVFVDTSRDPLTKKLNPDPMVLIQGIDGSLRTPSSDEKSVIINKIRPQKVKRDYESILNRPIKYRLPSQQQYVAPKVKEEEVKQEEVQI